MTWIIKHLRTGSSIAADYECPTHGHFTVSIERDPNGDPPSTTRCAVIDREPDGEFWCGAESPWRPTAALCRVQRVTAARRGKDPEPPPGAMDWRSLAEGMDHDEWEAKERKRDFEDVHRIVKKALA